MMLFGGVQAEDAPAALPGSSADLLIRLRHGRRGIGNRCARPRKPGPSLPASLGAEQGDRAVQHPAMEVTNDPPLRVRPTTQVAERAWLLRAHDIKGVVSCLELVAEELRAARNGRATVLGDRVRRACDRLMQLAGAAPGAKADAAPSLAALIDDVALFARALAGPRTRIEIEAPDIPIRAEAETAVFRILLNLVSNAVRATNAAGGGSLRLLVDLASGEVVILVLNDGVGLVRPCAAPVRRGQRSGLGLVIAEALAEELGGRLELGRSRPGATALRLVLPLAVFTDET